MKIFLYLLIFFFTFILDILHYIVYYNIIKQRKQTSSRKVKMVVDMEIKRLKNTKFGTNKIARVVTGWALYEAGKGWIAFSNDRDQFGILIPYIPCGGKKALQSILDAGGFVSFDGMEYVTEL